MRYQIDEKTTKMNYRYICPQTYLVFSCRIIKCSLELEMSNMQVASTKIREAPLNSLTVDTLIQDKGRKITKNSGNYYLQICFRNDVIQIT